MDRTTLLSVVVILLIVLSFTTEHRANASCVSSGSRRWATRCSGRKREKTNAEFLKDQLSSLESVR